jgi:DNA-binding MarR family transcriptional regulator
VDDLEARVLFLLREAGDSRACELAEFIGTTTCDMAAKLKTLEAAGKVRRYSVTAAIEKWALI